MTRAVEAPMELRERFHALYGKRYTHESDFVPGTEIADQIKQLMVDLKNAGCFVRRFEWNKKGRDGITVEEKWVVYDFCEKYFHGTKFLRVRCITDNLDGSVHIDLDYTGDAEYLRWLD
jgi:hypothetical protein